jgi:hypothetical protein
MPAPKSITLTFALDKETKGTRRFREHAQDGECPVVGSIYLLKPTLAELGDPKRVEVTITAAE